MDMRGKDGKAQAAGQAKEADLWIWRAGRPAGLSSAEEAEWNTELDHVKWFHLRALLDRSKEEHETLDEEFSRTIDSFHKSANIWRCLAKQGKAAGRNVYAEKQADMYSELASRCFIARRTLPQVLVADLKKQELKEAKEAEKAKKLLASVEESTEDLWETLDMYYSTA
ncbi:hypothetical protein C8R44DRAFT_876203 [Mycena epipterygia]|nr:hypothetical protein C8R44DRAFT_876203 [Mycena epipterygia]